MQDSILDPVLNFGEGQAPELVLVMADFVAEQDGAFSAAI
jgi:hypothetical protein